MDFVTRMNSNVAHAKARALKVIALLGDNSEFVREWDIEHRHGTYCFRITYKRFTSLCISVSAVKILDWNAPETQALETALWKNGTIGYDPELGYEDVCGHSDHNELIDDLKELVIRFAALERIDA